MAGSFTDRFNQLVSPLRTLRWRLTLSHALVTVSALVFVEVALVALILSYLALNSTFTPDQLIDSLNVDLVPLVRPYLAKTPPDQAGLSLLLKPFQGGMQESEVRSTLGKVQLSLSTNIGLEVHLISRDGLLLGTVPYSPELNRQVGQPYDADATPGLSEPLEAALSGETDYQKLYTAIRPDNRLVGAVPVLDQGRPVGALAFTTESLPWGTWVLGGMAEPIGLSLIVFTLLAGLMGLLFGSLTARGLVQRLNRLSEATAGWSQGDFAALVVDPAGDEVGRLARDLNHMAQQLENLLDKRQEMSVLEERNRLARDLHDSAKQQAFAASAQLGAARALFDHDPPAAQAHLVEAERLVYGVRQELTHLIQELRPVALKGAGLVPALREYGLDWANQNHIEIDVLAKGERPLPLEVEQTLFRVAQEALANVARHSRARKVEVALVYNAGAVTMTISDNGCGFDVRDEQAGLGLRSMRERIGLLDGCVEITSAIGQGTCISVRCPCQG